MNKKVLLLAIIIVILSVILSGFAYAYLDKVYQFNQTKNYFQSLGFDVIDMPMFVPKAGAMLHVADVTSFVSIAREYNITTIIKSEYSFIFITILSVWYEYTPSKSIWWIWG